MAYDEELADRVRKQLQGRDVAWDEKRMMGGLCFMVDEKMLVGVSEDRLMVRLDPDDYPTMLQRPGAEPMDFTGRPMRGFLWVFEQGIRGPSELGYWIEEALKFNPRAKAPAKKKKQKR
jgi:TfoX/Sxy family transcriptional regulator of competence genes